MWFKQYRDYPIDQPLIKEPVEPSRGIIGCEMHELNGWGAEHHIPKKNQGGFFFRFFSFFIQKTEKV